MSKKENTTGTTMATEIIRDMKRDRSNRRAFWNINGS